VNTKDQIMADMSETSREVVEKYPELKGLAYGLALKLLTDGKTKDDVATDARVLEWTRSLPRELVEDGYALYALCHMTEGFMEQEGLRYSAIATEDEQEKLKKISAKPVQLIEEAPE